MVDDSVDAAYLRAIFDAAKRWEVATGRSVHGKPLREAVWFVWQQPRLPRPLVRSKYPTTAPWTAAAREAHATEPNPKLIMEHVEPINLLIRRLLDAPGTDAEFIASLTEALRFCVVTANENRALEAAKVARSAPDADDPWSRYRAAGIDVQGIGPLLA